MSERRLFLAFAAGLFLTTAIAYQPALSAGWIWDDDDYVTQNPVLRDGAGLVRIWTEPTSLPQYYPLVHTSFWLHYQIHGLEPFGYHLVNVLIHALSACLLFLIFRRLALPGGYLAALLFALHPVHVESVAWVTERKNVFVALFSFASLLAWLRWRETETRRDLVCAVLFFVAALASKTVACALPAVFLVIAWWRDGRWQKREVVAALPMLALGLVMGLVTVTLEKTHVLAQGAAWDFDFMQRVAIAGRAVWFYVGKLLLPLDLVFIYPRFDVAEISVIDLWPAALVLVTLGALWALRGRIGRGPLAACLIFGGVLFPALGFFDVYPMRYSFVADHFQYPASTALLSLAAVALALGARRLAPRVPGGAVLAAAGLLCVALATITWQRCHAYADLRTLWEDTAERNPAAAIAWINLGKLELDAGRTESGLDHLRRAVSLPDGDLYETHLNLGAGLYQVGDTRGALEHFETAVTRRPDRPEAHNNLGSTLQKLGRAADAENAFRRAIELEPHYPAALRNLSALLSEKPATAERDRERRALLESVLEMQPRDLEVRRALVGILERLRDRDAVFEHAAKISRLAPQDVAARGAVIKGLLRQRRGPQAAAQVVQLLPHATPDDLARLSPAIERALEAVTRKNPASGGTLARRLFGRWPAARGLIERVAGRVTGPGAEVLTSVLSAKR